MKIRAWRACRVLAGVVIAGIVGCTMPGASTSTSLDPATRDPVVLLSRVSTPPGVFVAVAPSPFPEPTNGAVASEAQEHFCTDQSELSCIEDTCRIMGTTQAAQELFDRNRASPLPNPPFSPIELDHLGTSRSLYYIFRPSGSMLGLTNDAEGYDLEWVDGLLECVQQSVEPVGALSKDTFLALAAAVERAASQLGLTVAGA